jgi:hypothetical protein
MTWPKGAFERERSVGRFGTVRGQNGVLTLLGSTPSTLRFWTSAASARLLYLPNVEAADFSPDNGGNHEPHARNHRDPETGGSVWRAPELFPLESRHTDHAAEQVAAGVGIGGLLGVGIASNTLNQINANA